MEIKWNKNFLEALDTGINYEIGSNERETTRNIEAAMKKAGISPVRAEVQKIAAQHHN